MTLEHDFLAAWQAWEDTSAGAALTADMKKAREGRKYRGHTGGDARRAHLFETLTQQLATAYGMNPSRLRQQLTEWRRAGLTRDEALATVLDP